jgi:hypothetical protein
VAQEIGAELRDSVLIQRYLFHSAQRMDRVVRGANARPEFSPARRPRERAPVVSAAAGCCGNSPGLRRAWRLALVQAGAGERMTRAVLFDLDDTLFDHHRSAGAALLRVHEQFAPSSTFEASSVILALPRRMHIGARRPRRDE